MTLEEQEKRAEDVEKHLIIELDVITRLGSFNYEWKDIDNRKSRLQRMSIAQLRQLGDLLNRVPKGEDAAKTAISLVVESIVDSEKLRRVAGQDV